MVELVKAFPKALSESVNVCCNIHYTLWVRSGLEPGLHFGTLVSHEYKIFG